MNRELKILCLEDNPNDVELIRNAIDNSDINYFMSEARDEQEYRKLLTESQFDIIFSDYSLPSFDGLTALEIAKELSPGTPFILISGTIGEDAAIDSMLKGATDYIPKSKLFRLVPSIKRVIKELHEKRIRKEISDAYKLLVEQSLHGMGILSEEGFLFFNSKLIDLFGYSKDEIRSFSLNDFIEIIIHPSDRTLKRKKLLQQLESRISNSKDTYRIQRKDGAIRDIQDISSPIVYKGKQSLQIIFNDITEEKEVQEQIKASEEKYRLLFETMAQGVVFQDSQGRITSANSMAEKILGLTIDQLMGRESYDPRWKAIREDGSAFPGDEHPSMITLKTGKPVNNVIMGVYNPKEEIYKWILINSIPLFKDNENTANQVYTTFVDISSLKNAENALRASEERYKNLIENLNEGFTVHDLNLNIIFANEKFCEMLGYSLEELKGLNTLELLDENNQKKLIYSSSLNNKTKKQYDLEFISKSGKKVYTIVSPSVLYDENNQIVGSYAVITDITQRILDEDEIRKISAAIEQSPLSIIITNFDGIIEYVNPALLERTGYTINELIGVKTNIFGSGKTPSSVYAELWSKIKSGVTWKGDLLNKKKNGELFWESMIISPITNHSGEITNFLSIKEDITEKKRNEERIKTLTTAVEQSPIGFVLCNKDGIINYSNQKFSEFTHYSSDEILHKRIDFFIPIWTSSKKQFSIDQAILYGNEWHGEIELRTRNNNKFWTAISLSPIKDNQDKVINFVITFEDITERKALLSDLIEAKEKAEEMSRLKSSFLSNMSHELRTPMVGILGFAEYLNKELEKLGDEELNDMARMILKSSKRLMNTLNSILDLSRIEANKQEMRIILYNLKDLLSESIHYLEPIAKQKGLNLIMEVLDNNATCEVDEDMIIQIANNLIDNAIKFTFKGEVRIEIGSVIKDSNKLVYFRVIDTGIGIDPKYHNIIFDEFRQESEGIQRNFEGAGLGLTLTKKYVELLNGKIELTSKPAEGSTFSVFFKYSPDPNYLSETISAEPRESSLVFPQKILLVENDDMNKIITKKYLEGLCEFDFAFNGEEAVDRIQKNQYDLILMDINLGHGMTGVDVMLFARNIEYYKHIPIIALTAYAMSGDKDEFLSKGFDAYISKPFTKELLINTIKSLF